MKTKPRFELGIDELKLSLKLSVTPTSLLKYP